MQLKNLNFETWCKNHQDDHNSKWCRELYPYDVLREINFSHEEINSKQRIKFNGAVYEVIITKIELQENARYRTTFNLCIQVEPDLITWHNRFWDTQFQIVYTVDYGFITVFTKNEDPSKKLVSSFMKGNFSKIITIRSLPVSALLFRTLVLHISEENFLGGKYNKSFPFIKNGIRNLPAKKQFEQGEFDVVPIYSVNRKIWITFSFNESKAHRLAIHIANQCEKLYVIYCNPTYTKHHRCTYSNTHIISPYEFSSFLKLSIRKKFDEHIRFLQNHLNPIEKVDLLKIKTEIENPTESKYLIKNSDLMEAFSILKIKPVDEYDTFYILTAFNLINAWLGQELKVTNFRKHKSNLKNVYSFKKLLSDFLEKC